MNRYEKIAWFNLAVISASILLFFAIFYSTRASYSLNVSLKISFAAFGLAGFIGLGQALFKKTPGGQDSDINDDIDGHDTLRYDAELDERDILIRRRAALYELDTSAHYTCNNPTKFSLPARFKVPESTIKA